MDVLSEAERKWPTFEEDHKFTTWKTQLGLFMDDGGRLKNADILFSTVLLNKQHTFTTLLVQAAHRRVQHNGVRETLGEIRVKYGIIKGRSLVKARCVVCRRYEGRSIKPPPAPPLPFFRVNEAPPFSYTAVDYAGPMYVGKQKGDKGKKVWICLFTCCVTRAIHLEIVCDMSTPTFIRALRRFSARRGFPKRILSDNAKTFKAASRFLQTLFSSSEVKDYLANLGVEWVFNLERAPWWGGVFERMVKSTKRCLRKTIGRARFSLDEMHTAIVEIEGIINSRPISYLESDDAADTL